jgi:hypothetical protein
VLIIAFGFGGPLGSAEGPVWIREGGYLLFSDINTSMRASGWKPGHGVTVFQENTHQANGLTRDQQGRRVACEHETRRVTRRELDGSLTAIANSFQGKRLNRPNDVVVKSDASIYFNDPNGASCPSNGTWALPAYSAFRLISAPSRSWWTISSAVWRSNQVCISMRCRDKRPREVPPCPAKRCWRKGIAGGGRGFGRERRGIGAVEGRPYPQPGALRQ